MLRNIILTTFLLAEITLAISVHAAADGPQIIAAGVSTEQSIRTVSLNVVKTAPGLLGPPTTISQTISIDNNLPALKEVTKGPSGDTEIALKTPTVSKIEWRFPPAGKYAMVDKRVIVHDPQWPLFEPEAFYAHREFTNWQYFIDHHRLRIASSEIGPNSVVTLTLNSTDRPVSSRVEIDLAHSYRILRIDRTEQGTGRKKSSVSFQYSGDRGWPSAIFVGNYDKSGSSILGTTTYTLKDVQVNSRQWKNDTDFGPYPRGYVIQDTRFHPALSYVQGRKQFTDQELFDLSKHPELLSQVGSSPTEDVSRYRTRSTVFCVVGILMLISGILVLRRRA